MPVEIIIGENSLDPLTWERIETDDVCETLFQRWGQFPQNTRIFYRNVAESQDVTPKDDAGILVLQKLNAQALLCPNSNDRRFYVFTFPQFFLFGLTGLFGTLLKILLFGLLTYLLTPKPPKSRNTQQDSPNNGLSDRTNEARPGARIPDIFGRVRSTPDLLSNSYFTFEHHREVEFSYMCIGRGHYLVEDIKDDDTPVEDISGLAVEVYGPNTSPHSDDEPQIQIGVPINERVWVAVKQNGVNGQILRPPNTKEVEGDENIAFNWPDQIVTNNENEEIDFEEFFGVDDVINITDAIFDIDIDGTPTEINLSGQYIVLAVEKNTLVLNDPARENDQWDLFGTADESASPYISPTIETSSERWIGPFTVEEPYAVYNNFVAQNGLYKDDGEEQESMDVVIEVQFLPVDENGDATGPMQDGEVTVFGSKHLQNMRAATLKYTTAWQDPNAGVGTRWQVRARRLTETDLDYDGRVVDEIQWRDLYAMRYVANEHFGEVTTVFTKTYATNAALTVKERKLNCWVTRKIPARVINPDGTGSITEYTEELYPTVFMGLILRAIALDPHLGNMTEDQLDYNSIFSAEGGIINYFGTPKCAHFNHTFDDKELSAEEMIAAVAEACFCTAYRQGNQLRLMFEKKTELSTLLFNHRNKLPGTEQRSIRFGSFEDNDGVDLEWVDPDDGAVVNFLIPDDQSAVNPKKVDIVGIQNEVQAHMHAWRVYNKIIYQNIAVEFEATQEAILLIRNEKILVADNTRNDTQDGQVVEQDGLNLTLSQKVAFESGGYTIFLQLYDGTVEALNVTAGASEYEVVLNVVPRLPLVVDNDKFAQTTYYITKNDSPREKAFLVSEKEPKDSHFTWKINAVNYDERYYQNDTDYIDGIIDEAASRIIFKADFEEYDIPLGENQLIANPSGFTSSFVVDIKNNQVGVGPAASGENLAEVEDGNILYVDLPTDPAKKYELIMYYSPRPGLDAAHNELHIYWNGILVIPLIDDGTDLETTDWRSIFRNLWTPTGATTRLEIRSMLDDNVGEGGLIDNVRVREID